jgi:hypothetical protein
VIFRGLEQIGQGLESAAGMGWAAANAFETVMSRIKGLTTTPEADLAKMGDDVIGLSKTLNLSAKELGEAEYFIASSGFAGVQATDILTASAKAASAGLGQTKTIADAVTSALNAYKLKAGDAAHITDVLTRAVVEGKGEPDALAGAIARVLPIAAQAGVAFEEVMASMATMTRTGLSAEEAATALRGTLSALLAPGKEAKQTLMELGYSTDSLRTAIKDKGLMQVLTELVNRAGGVRTQFALVGDAATKAQNEMDKARDSTAKITRALPLEQQQLSILNRELVAITEKYGASSIQADQKRLAIEKLSSKMGDENAQLAENSRIITVNELALKTQITVQGDMIETMDKIIPNIRALTGVLSTASSQGDAYAQILASMGDAAGSVDKAFAASAGTWEFQFGRFKNVLLAMPIELGEKVLPGLTGILDAVTKDISGKTSGWADLVAGWLGPTIGRLQAAAQTGGIQGVMAEIGKLINEGWTLHVQPKLQEWATKFFEWITGKDGAQAQVPSTMSKLLVSIRKWADDSDTQDQMGAFGETVSRALMKGVGVVLKDGAGTWMPIWSDMALVAGENLIPAAFELGGAFSAHFLMGLYESLGLGAQFKGGLGALMNIKHFLTGTSSTTNNSTSNQTVYGGINNYGAPTDPGNWLGSLVP